MRDIGRNIKDLRMKQNMTQEELADKLFVTRQTVSNYENGKSRPDVDMVIKIADVLNTDANTVFYGIPTPPDRRKAYRRLIIGCAVLLVLAVTYWILEPVAEDLGQYYFRFGLRYVLWLYLRPLLLLTFGWCLFHGLSLLLEIKELTGKWERICKWVLVDIAILLLTCTLPWMAFTAYCDFLATTTGSVNLSFPNIPVITDIVRAIMMMDAKAPAVYALLGGMLRLFQFPK